MKNQDAENVHQRLLLRPDEAAAAMGISRSKLYELIAIGTLPSIKVGARGLRIRPSAVERWLDAQDKTIKKSD